MEDNNLYVIKANGDRELFSEEKVIRSIHRAGIPANLQQETLQHIRHKIYNNIPTSEIYQHISEYLKASSEPYGAGRYSLKRSLMELGPTGYPFEDFVSDLLTSQGYKTKVRQILQGKCITHEIDVVAKKEDKTIVVECKFHNGPGIKSDVHVAMYTKARFDDIKEHNKVDEIWLVTNTKATTDAIKYGLCGGVKVLAWDYPAHGSLRDLIEDANLHPLTEMTTLTTAQKQVLFANHIILCKEVLKNPNLLDVLHLEGEKFDEVMEEITYICRGQKGE